MFACPYVHHISSDAYEEHKRPNGSLTIELYGVVNHQTWILGGRPSPCGSAINFLNKEGIPSTCY